MAPAKYHSQILAVTLLLIAGSGLLFHSPSVHAYAYTTWYGVFQHPEEAFRNASLIRDGVYERQENGWISGYMQAIFSEQYGFPPVEGEDWTFELYDTQANELLGYVSYYYSGGCLYVDVGATDPTKLGCLADPSEDYVFYFIGTFETRCLETRPYQMKASHFDAAAPDTNFEPTPFQPAIPFVMDDSLQEVPPKLRYEPAGKKTSITVSIVDNLKCGRPVEDLPVTISSTIFPWHLYEGSHTHFPDRDEPGTGEFVSSMPAATDIDSNGTKIVINTDQDGLINAEYEAGIYGLKETFEVSGTNPVTGEELSIMDFLDIRIPGLVGLSHNSDTYGLLGSYNPGCDEEHNDAKDVRRSHYLLPDVKEAVESVAGDYYVRTGGKLSFNDASLSYGGVFDAGTSDRTEKCHSSHRKGIDIDVNGSDSLGRDIWFDFYHGPNSTVILLFEDLERRAIIRGGRRVIENNSIHYRFDRIY